MVLHWKLNRDACILNNLENWLRHRRWRAPETNREEGAWLRTLLADATGISLTRGQDGCRHLWRDQPVLAGGAGPVKPRYFEQFQPVPGVLKGPGSNPISSVFRGRLAPEKPQRF